MSAEPSASRPALTFTHETPQDQPAVEALLDRAFGPGRYVKVSERVREFADFAAALSFLGWAGEELLGVVRQWRVRVGETPVVVVKDPTNPISGTAILTPAQEADLLAGKWYFNVHTAAHPGGEIRGQVERLN